MTGATYLDHLNDQMRALELEITRARHKLELDALEAKAEALKQLSRLQIQQQDLAERIQAAAMANAEAWSDMQKSMRLEADGLRDTFSRWLSRFY